MFQPYKRHAEDVMKQATQQKPHTITTAETKKI
jgi:hypothetical protein